MKISVSIRRDGPRFVASSTAPECSGEGETCEEALEELRLGLVERLAPVSIAPPDGEVPPAIELVVDAPSPSPERSSPDK